MLGGTYLRGLALAKQTQIRMMADRGHAVPEDERALLVQDPDAVAAHYAVAAQRHGCSLAEALGGIYEPAAAATEPPQGNLPERTAVAFLDMLWDDCKRRSKMSSTDQVKTVIDAVARRARNIMIVVPSALTPEAKREIVEAGAAAAGGAGAGPGGNIYVQVVTHKELSFVAVDHVHTPKHERLSDTAVEALMRDCNLHATLLPLLPDSDAVSVHYDYREGDVIKVTRPHSVQYRIVRRDMS